MFEFPSDVRLLITFLAKSGLQILADIQCSPLLFVNFSPEAMPTVFVIYKIEPENAVVANSKIKVTELVLHQNLMEYSNYEWAPMEMVE